LSLSYQFAIYLQFSDLYCWREMKRGVGLATSARSSLHRIWKDKRLSFQSKIRLFQAVVLSVLLNASDTWTAGLHVRAADMRTLETFYIKCLRQILEVRWQQHITNSELSRVGLGPLAEQIARRRKAIYYLWSYRTTRRLSQLICSSAARSMHLVVVSAVTTGNVVPAVQEITDG